MMDKLFLLRAIIFALMLGIFAWDLILQFTQSSQPWQHRDILLTAFLLWIVSVLFPQDSDDDWAGQF